MCIAILTKAGTKLFEEQAQASMLRNSAGAGYAFVNKKGVVVVDKGYFDFPKFWKAYSEAWEEYGKDSPFLLHFRIATSGGRTEDNCHPFLMKDGKAALIHNGILWSGSLGDQKSDTRKFVEETQELLADSTKINDVVLKRIEVVIGSGNKMVILYANKEYRIINDGRKNERGFAQNDAHWNEDGTVWFSNHTYKPWKSSYIDDYEDWGHGHGLRTAIAGSRNSNNHYAGVRSLTPPISPSNSIN